MSRTVNRLLDEAESEIIQEAANPLVEQYKEEVLEENKHRLNTLIKEEKEKLHLSSATIQETARDIATLSARLDQQNSLFGYKKGSNYYVAARLYMQGRRLPEIEKETGIPKKELNRLVNHKTCGWKLSRDRMMETIALELKKENLPILKHLSQMGYSLIEKAFEERLRKIDDLENPEPMQLHEATQVATIMAFVSREKRLDEESDLSRKEKSLTPSEIFKQFAEDPYFGPAFKRMVKDVVPLEITVNGAESGDSAES